MRDYKKFADRLADQADARAKAVERAKKIAFKSSVETKAVVPGPAPAPVGDMATDKPREGVTRAVKAWKVVREGASPLEYYARTAPDQRVYPQPWIRGIVNSILEAACEGGVRLCLVWPARLNSIPMLHALANVERNFNRDLLGLRTLMYPGSYATRAGLQGALVNGTQLSDFYRSLWHSDGSGTHLRAQTESESFVAMLSALNNIRMYVPEGDNPAVAELIPTFLFESSGQEWGCSATYPLERSLKKVKRLEARRGIREKINAEWANACKAPGALMVIHRNTSKQQWKSALAAPALMGDAKPEVLLLDATAAAERGHYKSVGLIPEFVRTMSESGHADIGAVIITDDPKTYFITRAKLAELKISFKTSVWAAEAEDSVLSTAPVGCIAVQTEQHLVLRAC